MSKDCWTLCLAKCYFPVLVIMMFVHYESPRNMIKIGRGKDMGDGWETARRLDRPPVLHADEKGILQVPGSEWAAFKLGLPGYVRAVEVDTNHFKVRLSCV